MTRLTFPAPALERLTASLLERTDVESCAVATTRYASGRITVAQHEVPPDDAYSERTAVSAVLRPEYLADLAGRARRAGLGCLLAHSHPRDRGMPRFSARDDAGERRLADYLRHAAPGADHAALVTSPGGIAARVLGTGESLSVQEIGRTLRVASGPHGTGPDGQVRFDRQIRAFGAEGQRRIADLHVGVVGSGGTGSLTIQQLGHLGVRRFTIVDFDSVEETNLNRLAGAGAGDVGRSKAEVARRSLHHIDPEIEVEVVEGDVTDDAVARRLFACDLLFLCTDSHASRAVVNQMAYQYLIPVIDQGVSLSVRQGQLAFITGRVQLLAPGLPCLTCMDILDPEQIRREMLTPQARAADPYIVGFHEPQPSVISLNGTIASLAVTMFIGVVTSAPVDARLQIYDGRTGKVTAPAARRDETCFVCSAAGALAKGAAWPLPTRPQAC